MLVTIINALILLLTPLAGPYRVLAYKPRSFGGTWVGTMTWSGVAGAYPAYLIADRSASLWSWPALGFLAYLQMMAQWCSAKPRRDEGVSQCWFGRFELAFAVALGFAARAAVGPGAGEFFLVGYACSVAQVWLVRVRRRCAAWTREDTARVMAPVRATLNGGRVVLKAASAGGSVMAREIAPLLPVKREPPGSESAVRTEGGAATAAPQPPISITLRQGMTSRIANVILGHMVLSAVTSVFGLNILFIPIAVVLWLGGWGVEAPSSVKEQARGLFARGKDALVETKEEAIARLEREKTELLARMKAEKAELKDKAGEVVREAVWGGLAP